MEYSDIYPDIDGYSQGAQTLEGWLLGVAALLFTKKMPIPERGLCSISGFLFPS